MSPVSPPALRTRTPAKLNLGLRVVGRRDDGYHLIESVFAPIELWDELEIEFVAGPPGVDLEVSMAAGAGLPKALADVPAGPENLVHRAASLYAEAMDLERRIRIRLLKSIPAAAGLGGGSSDAAAVLRGLDALVDPTKDARIGDARRAALIPLALRLGADVPFFLAARPAHVSGIGELIEPLEGLPQADLVVANPGISLATAEVYRVADVLAGALTDPRPGSTMRAFSRLSGAWQGPSSTREARPVDHSDDDPSTNAWGDLLVNDLQPAAIRLCPPVGRLLTALVEAGAIGTSMTGSGATVFGVFRSHEEAVQAAERLSRIEPARSWVRVTRLAGAA